MQPKGKTPKMSVGFPRALTLDLGAAFRAFVAPICKNAHDNTNMALIGIVLVSLAATISLLATARR